jgi:hypothetical protein
VVVVVVDEVVVATGTVVVVDEVVVGGSFEFDEPYATSESVVGTTSRSSPAPSPLNILAAVSLGAGIDAPAFADQVTAPVCSSNASTAPDDPPTKTCPPTTIGAESSVPSPVELHKTCPVDQSTACKVPAFMVNMIGPSNAGVVVEEKVPTTCPVVADNTTGEKKPWGASRT